MPSGITVTGSKECSKYVLWIPPAVPYFSLYWRGASSGKLSWAIYLVFIQRPLLVAAAGVPISLYLTTLAEASSCDGVLVILNRLLESNASLRRLGGQDSPLLLVE